jgi:hypothetical protein
MSMAFLATLTALKATQPYTSSPPAHPHQVQDKRSQRLEEVSDPGLVLNEHVLEQDRYSMDLPEPWTPQTTVEKGEFWVSSISISIIMINIPNRDRLDDEAMMAGEDAT